ncbi:MAG: FAD binding domain-containing protein [Chloroflexi bacterium]|nr:FAD binding domain-containing protein [Chloroflexota bacterium]
MTAATSRWNEYHTPTAVEEALALLTLHAERARIIAGGTDLILDMEAGHAPPVDALVDVTRIAGMTDIREEGDWIVIGAGVTHAQIETSDLLRRHAACLTESCAVVGGPQVRNVATIGGNVAHALPAADGTIGLLALDAEVEVCTLTDGQVERRWQPLLSIFAGPGRNTLGHHQMLGGFRFHPRAAGEASAFDRIMRPQGVALPVLGLAVWLRLDEDWQRIVAARIAIGPAGPVPFRASEAEAVLTGAPQFDASVLDAAVAAAQAQAQLRTSKHRASKEYRYEMVGVLLGRVLPVALERAGNL